MKNKKKFFSIFAACVSLSIFAVVFFVRFSSKEECYNIYPYMISSIKEEKENIIELSHDIKKGYTFFSGKDSTITELSYEADVEKNDFYMIYVDFDSIESDDNTMVGIYSDDISDINEERIYVKKRVSEYSENQKIERMIKSNKEGKIKFKISFSGKIEAGISVKVAPIISDNKYKLFTSEDESVRMIFASEDIEKLGIQRSEIELWVEKYAEIRKAFVELTGGNEPYEKTTDYVMTESFDYIGLAGNPIYINRNYVDEIIGEIVQNENNNDMVSWELVHEMSHTFDGIKGSDIENIWNFDSEFFADLKLVCILGRTGFYTEESFYEYLKNSEKMNTLDNGVYNSQGFTYLFFSVVYNIDNNYLEHLYNILKRLVCNYEKNGLPDNRFLAFEISFFEEYQKPLQSFLTENEYKTLERKYKLID